MNFSILNFYNVSYRGKLSEKQLVRNSCHPAASTPLLFLEHWAGEREEQERGRRRPRKALKSRLLRHNGNISAMLFNTAFVWISQDERNGAEVSKTFNSLLRGCNCLPEWMSSLVIPFFGCCMRYLNNRD